MRTYQRWAARLILLFLGVIGAGCLDPAGDPPDEVPPVSPEPLSTVYLPQGWTRDEAQDFYYTTQGSQFIPYTWFLSLQQSGQEELFRADDNMARLGFIPQPREAQKNPDGLPIGFVKDDSRKSVDMPYATREALHGGDYPEGTFPATNSWMGLTCAACHTGEIRYGGKALIVDGAPASIDYQTFAGELLVALRETAADDARFTSFARRVLDSFYNETEAAVLRTRLAAYADVLAKANTRNTGAHPYGYARLDAFGAILNAVCETALELPENHGVASAPVSFPFLWDTPQLDWVQWNGSIANPIARNVGEVLGVFAHFKLTGTAAEGQFSSTANIENLFRLEQMVASLSAPKWPAEILGPIDQAKADLGRDLYAQNCARCHHVPDAQGEYPRTPPNKFGKQFIKTVMIPVQAIGTDPLLIQNIGRSADPGALRPFLPEEIRTAPSVPAAALLTIADGGVIKRALSELSRPLEPEQLLAMTGFRDPDVSPPNPLAYKARPLDGIWATAPFLHNGSVPNLYQVLLPARERDESFYLGNRKFDPVAVGYETQPAAGSSAFRTKGDDGRPIPGNSNAGHEGKYYTQAKDGGAWRDFTEEERWALVEYMKTL